MEPNHEYSINESKTPFGSGIEVSKNGSRYCYKQIECKDGLIARIFPSEETSQGEVDSFLPICIE